LLDTLLDSIRLGGAPLDGCLFLFAGALILILGAEVFVMASVRLSRRLGLPRIAVGLTLVAIGTSLPELASSLVAVLQEGEKGASLAVGNVVGSNVANIGLVLGLAALIRPVSTGESRIWPHLLVLVLVTGGFTGMVYALGTLTVPVALGGMAVFLVYTWLLFRPKVAAWPGSDALESERPGGGLVGDILLFVIGAALVGVGSETLVKGAVETAVNLGVSAGVVGAALVAVGTSIPELAVCFSAARRREAGILLGNLIGSNIANLLLVFGVVSLIRPLAIGGEALNLYLPAMSVFTILMVVGIVTHGRVKRVEGLVLLALYALFQVIVWVQ